jgi:hypothetical protein
MALLCISRFRIRSALVALGLAALSACASQRWDHPQSGAANLPQDLAECEHTAEVRAHRFAERDPFTRGPESFRAPDGRTYFESPADRRSDTILAESETRTWCMRNKGYVRVPDSQ